MLTSYIFWFIIICIMFSVFMYFSTMFYVLLSWLSDSILLSSEFFLVNFFVVFIFLKAAAFCMITFSLVCFFKNILEINKYFSERKFFMFDRRSSFLTFFFKFNLNSFSVVLLSSSHSHLTYNCVELWQLLLLHFIFVSRLCSLLSS